MHRFEYEIQLNEDGRPYINIPENYTEKPEDKFMALELTCYILRKLLETRQESLDDEAIQSLEISFDTLIKISDEVGMLIKNDMETLGDMVMQVNNQYHFQVKTITEMNSLNYNGIIRGDKIFKRVIGLRVLINSENKIYELVDGIDNENWKVI